MNWPEPSPGLAPLGDGRLATVADRPGSAEELREVVRGRVAQGLAIYPQGGRTAIDYGGIPRRPGAAVDMTAMGRVIDYPAADMTITVEAGITLAALAAVLDGEGQRLEIDAPEQARATVGGVYATNATGPRRHRWGRPRDQIIGVGFVTADGNLIKGGGRVVKNVAGYDFPKLLTGSMGTLGVIAHVTLKVRPKPEASAVVMLAYAGLDAVAPDLGRLNESSTRPAAIELLDAAAAAVVAPEAGRSPWLLAVGFEDNAAAVDWQVKRLPAELAGSVVATRTEEAAAGLWASLREATARPAGEVGVVANVPRSGVAKLAAIVARDRWALRGHAGSGVVRLDSLIGDLEAIAADVHGLREFVESIGGNLIVARCPTSWKDRLKVWGNPRPDWAWNERVKDTLDPGRVMNPGRFVGTI